MHEAVSGTRKKWAHYSQPISPVHDAVASYKQRKERNCFSGKSESDKSQSQVHFKNQPCYKQQRQRWGFVNQCAVTYFLSNEFRLLNNSFPFI